MFLDVDDEEVDDAIERSNCSNPLKRRSGFEEMLSVAINGVPRRSGILELSSAGLYKLPDGDSLGTVDCLVLVNTLELVIVQMRGVFKKRPEKSTYPLTSTPGRLSWDPTSKDYSTDKNGSFDIQGFGAGHTPVVRLGWDWWRKSFSVGTDERLNAATERDRILGAIQSAIQSWDR